MDKDERRYGEELGARIAEARGEKSQVAFSSELGINKNTLLRYEKGRGIPDLFTVRKICDLSGVNWDWMTSGVGPMRGKGGGSARAGMAEMAEKRARAQETIIEDSFDALGVVEGMALLTEIYSSGDTIYIRAINANLQAFSDAVKSKAKATQMEATVENMRAELADMHEQLGKMGDHLIAIAEQNDELKRELIGREGKDPFSKTG